MGTETSVRADKWLWAVRLFKTRTLAAEACKAGHVKLAGANLKPARELRVGEVLTVQQGEITRTVKVAGLAERRVGAPAARELLEDLTPPEVYARQREQARLPMPPRGVGRPTKKLRRKLEKLGFIEE